MLLRTGSSAEGEATMTRFTDSKSKVQKRDKP